jgi:uncharacterized protein involved in cysteine biosynthesis
MRYPIEGIFFFAVHPSLWAISICPIIMTVLVAITSLVVGYGVVLYPQAILLQKAGLASWAAWLISFLLSTVEIVLTTVIYSATCLPCYLDKIFDKTLKLQSCEYLLLNYKEDCCRSCASCCRVSLFLRLAILIVTLPLHAIPIVGTIAWIYLNGTVLAWETHQHYFDLKGWAYPEQRMFVKKLQAEYTAFGVAAMSLESIPGLGLLFTFTNAVGSALWAADLEKSYSSLGSMESDVRS